MAVHSLFGMRLNSCHAGLWRVRLAPRYVEPLRIVAYPWTPRPIDRLIARLYSTGNDLSHRR
jgi:hypothetical protein